MNVVLVHGWLSSPRQHWFFWLRRELEKRGYKVIAPRMPKPSRPSKDQWVSTLKQALKGLDSSQTILVGHSLGTPTILYVLNEHAGPKFAQVILVSSFARKIPHMDEFIEGYDMDFDLSSIKNKAHEWVCIHADNDPIVPFAEGAGLAKKLNAFLINETGRGHLTQYRGAVRLPSALKIILKQYSPGKVVDVKPSDAPMKLQSALEAILGIRQKVKETITNLKSRKNR